MELENIIYDYQSIADVFRLIVGEHVMDQVIVILGRDSGVGEFCLPLRTVERKRRKQTRTVSISFRVENDGKSYCYVVENRLKCCGKSKEAYRGGPWNGKDALMQ